MKSRNLPLNCSKEEFEQTWEFLNKVKEMDKEISHGGIFLQYINLMKLYQSGSLNEVDVKHRVATIFKNCDVLLDDFHRLLKTNDAAVLSNLKGVKEFFKMLSEEQKQGFIEAYLRYKVHNNVQIFKDQVDLMLRDYPPSKEEFRTFLVYNGLLHQVTDEDMFLNGLKSAIRFSEEGGDREKKPPVRLWSHDAVSQTKT